MNKTELAKAMVEKSQYNVTTTMAEDMINCFINVIKETVADGDKVQLIGFGTFEAADRAERNGKNPKTGEPIVIPACRVPKFRPGKMFKDIVK